MFDRNRSQNMGHSWTIKSYKKGFKGFNGFQGLRLLLPTPLGIITQGADEDPRGGRECVRMRGRPSLPKPPPSMTSHAKTLEPSTSRFSWLCCVGARWMEGDARRGGNSDRTRDTQALKPRTPQPKRTPGLNPQTPHQKHSAGLQ